MTANQQKAYLKRVAKEEEGSVFKGREVYATKHKDSGTNSKKKSCINFDKSIKNNFNVMHNDRSLRAEHIKDEAVFLWRNSCRCHTPQSLPAIAK